MKIIANGGVIQISLEGRGNLVHDFWTVFNSFKRVLGQYERTDENRERERERERPTDVESRWIAYACKYKEELDGTGERRRSH